jgi:hypothetical protein
MLVALPLLWYWGQYAFSKRLSVTARLHGAASQRTVFTLGAVSRNAIKLTKNQKTAQEKINR